MLEAMYQTGSWLVHKTEGFEKAVVALKEARNVKYADFVAPGQMLTVTAEILSHDDTNTKLKAQGKVNGEVAVSGRLVLERYNLADRQPGREATDARMRISLRHKFDLLFQPNSSSPIG